MAPGGPLSKMEPVKGKAAVVEATVGMLGSTVAGGGVGLEHGLEPSSSSKAFFCYFCVTDMKAFRQ